MSSEQQSRNSRQHRFKQTNRNGPQPSRNMERSWRRPDAPADSEMSTSAWRSPQNFIIEQDHIRRAEHKAEQERMAGVSPKPRAPNTKLEIVERPLSPTTTTPTAAPTTTSPSTSSLHSEETNTATATEHSGSERIRHGKYYVNNDKSSGLFSVEDINFTDSSSATSASHSPPKSTPVYPNSAQVEPSRKSTKNDRMQGDRSQNTSPGNGSWRNYNKPRQTKDSTGNRQHRQQQQLSQKPWRHMHADDKHYPHQPVLFRYFLDYDQVMTDLGNGDLFKCQLRINRRKRMDAYATSDVLGEDIYLCGEVARNRALDGDVVAVRLLDVDAVWEERTRREKRFSEKRKQRNHQQQEPQTDTTEPKDDLMMNSDNANENDTAIPVTTIAEDDTVSAKDNTAEQEDDDENSSQKPNFAGEVVYILDRAEGITYTGTISTHRPGTTQERSENETRKVWFKPTDKRIPLMVLDGRHVPKDVMSNPEQQLVEVALDRWPIYCKAPFGRFIRCIGLIGDLEAEEQAILTDNNILNTPFSALVMHHLNEIPRTIAAVEVKKRRDLRNEIIFTVDPIGAKDLDDALHIKRLDDGNFEVGVHIADVSYYVKQDTLLDGEAKRRGTTTYLVNKSIPMLPKALCEDLCSLTPLEDKLAFSVIWKMDQYGNVIDTWFGRTIIRSCAKLAYEDAQSVIDYNHLPEDTVITDYSKQQVESNITDLFNLSAAMRKRRYENGALSLNSIKLSFTLNDDGEPIGVSVFEAKEGNKMVEEFMLLANISVAQRIWKSYPSYSLLRRHDCPIERRLDQFLDLTKELGYDFDVGSAAGLQTSFDGLEDMDVKSVLQVLAIQPMKRASYVCSGAARNKNYLHYALNQDHYTHFTSPIRRYADVIVHRLLSAALDGKEDCGYDTNTVQRIALRCNRKKDGAKNAQDADIMLYLADYLSLLEKREGTQTEKAVVMGVNKKRFDVYVPKYGLEYYVQPGALPIQEFVYKDGRLDLYWKAGVPVTDAYYEKTRERKWDDADDLNNEDNIENTKDGDGAQIADGDDLDEITRDLSNASVGQDQVDGGDLPRKLHAAPLDSDKCMQSIDILATINVNIIPDKSQTPPRIHIFPLNPFC